MNRHLYGFADLHHHSHFSVLDSLPTPEEMVIKAMEMNRPALALTDHGTTSGHVLFEKAVEGYIQKQIGADTLKIRTGKRLDIKPLFGLEAYLVSSVSAMERQKNHITLLAMNTTGYRNLIQLVTRSYDEGFYYRASVDIQMLNEHSEGVLCLTGCESSILMRAIEAKDYRRARRYIELLQMIYGDNLYIELQHFPHAQDKQSMAYKYAAEYGIPHVVTCDVHYLEKADKLTHQFIMAIRDRCGINDAFTMDYARPSYPDKLLAGLEYHNPEIDWVRAMEHVVDVVEKIDEFKLPQAPAVIYPYDGDKIRYMRERCQAFLSAQNLPNIGEYHERLDRELNVIAGKGYEDYFMVVDDIIQWAKRQEIMVGPGRGSAAGSVVCWGLGITTVDPLRWGLMFERFVDPTRVDLPDIDIDFEDDRRHEVFQYIRDKYGEDNVANISTFIRFGGLNTLHDAARTFRIPRSAVDTISRYLPDRSSGDQRAELTIHDALQVPDVAEVFKQYPELEIASKLQGRIRSIGKHAAGVVVTSEPISNYAPIIQAPSTKERLVALDWRDAAYLNLMKIDVLGLKELTMIRRAGERVGMSLQDIYDIPLDDPAAIEVFNQRDYLGIFQYDGQAVRSIAGRITFESLQEIADVNALARPGPLHAGATEAYIKGREYNKYEPVIAHELVIPILERTYGQIIYQETVMRILREIGGMDWQSVCDVRQIMGKSKGSEMVDQYYPAWQEGCRERGISDGDIEGIWQAIRQYGKHAFNIAHAVSYGLLAYWGAWFKAHHPVEFYWSHLLKAADTAAEGRYIYEAQRKGIQFAPLGLGAMSETWDIVGGKITPGWSIVPNVGPIAAAELSAHAPYESMDDLKERTNGTKVNSKRRESIAEYLGKSVDEIYNLHIWALFPHRTPLNDLYPNFRGQVFARVRGINKKSKTEEATIKGKPVPPGGFKPDEYAVLLLEDDSGTIYGWIAAERYPALYDQVWNCKEQYVLIGGYCFSSNSAVLAVESVEIINPDEHTAQPQAEQALENSCVYQFAV